MSAARPLLALAAAATLGACAQILSLSDYQDGEATGPSGAGGAIAASSSQGATTAASSTASTGGAGMGGAGGMATVSASASTSASSTASAASSSATGMQPVIKRVFVSKLAYGANEGGVQGATNLVCGPEGKSYGVFYAFLSDGTKMPPCDPNATYVLMDGNGSKVGTCAQILAGAMATIDTPINTGANGQVVDVVTSAVAWTGIAASGATYVPAPTNCAGWTSAQSQLSGRVGTVGANNGTWLDTVIDETCGMSLAHFYCFEQ